MVKNNKKRKGKASSSAVKESVSTHTNSSIPVPSSAVGSQNPTNPNVRSPSPKSQSNATQSSDIATHINKFGPNANFARATAIAFGAQSTATHISYHIRLGDQELTQTQVEEFMMGLVASLDKTENLVSRSRTNLPRAMAAHNDYKPQKELDPCFQGTREAVLKKIAQWLIVVGTSQIYVISGLAGIGKSTIAYTVAQRADHIGLLGASFFFSRKEAERRTAERFFTTIAFQLCVYDDEFARAIQRVLATDQGKGATTKDPETQLKVLIIEPLRDLVRSRTQPVVIVVDALDECEDEDALVILKGLGQLVHEIPSFKVLLTTRPQPHLNHLLSSHDVFYLHNIEDKIVNNDIRRYLKFRLSIDQVKSKFPTLEPSWNATDDDINALVQAAGQLFIIASISVLFILNKAVRNPASQMKKLRSELAQNRTPFIALDDFYSIILHAVIPPDSDRFLVERFHIVVGTIVLLYNPLPIDALADLIGMQTVDIYGVLDNLQSVILLGADDIPYIFHESFSDWIMNAQYCKDKDYRIDPRDGHTWLTTRCLQTMNERLKWNLLNLDGVAQFMTPREAVKQRERISPVLRYVCIYWGGHLHEADANDAELIDQLKTFANEHWLHWIEVWGLLATECLITVDISGVIKFMRKTTFQDLHELLSDALRFTFRFASILERSVHFVYQSALPFTPTESLFYQRYKREAMHNLCRVQGGQKRWDAVITSTKHGQHVDRITFSERGHFASCSVACIRFWDSTTGNTRMAFTNSFSIVVGLGNKLLFGLSEDFLWSSNSKFSAPIVSIAFSSSALRLAVASSDGSIILWDFDIRKKIAEFDGFGSDSLSSHHLAFTPNGDRLAYRLADGGFALRNAINGELITDLNGHSSAMVRVHCLVFSPDGSQLASLFVEDDDKHTLALWNCTDGKFIGIVRDIGSELAFSADGSLIATGGWNNTLELWSRNNKDQGFQTRTPHLSSLKNISCLAFSRDDMLAIGSADTGVILYDVANRSFIATIPFRNPTAIAFSYDCTRLATGNKDGVVRLLDVPAIKTSAQTSQENSALASALVFSPDCSRLVSGSGDGIVRIWNTSCASEPIAAREGHSSKITTIAFTRNGGLFASGDANGTIKFWSSDDYDLSNTVQWPIAGELTSVAVSKYVLAAATNDSGIALWDLQRCCIIDRLGDCGSMLLSLSNQDENLLLASFNGDSNSVTVWDVKSLTPSATFYVGKMTERMVFYPDDSHLLVHDGGEGLLIFDVFDVGNMVLPNVVPISAHIDQGVMPSWKGIPVWMCCSNNHYFIRGCFSQGDGKYTYGTVCQLPEDLDVVKAAYGSSMFALLCRNGCLVLLQSN
ncbi:hypothetical protein M378DRAFT_162220 [Amanita muscaria Koide BX008]|uniref:Uncharacterized protein n=1 Tax=Amanita muscaria (strain Koide BX008) TaxID=946122 RepID=A0A0C2X7K1_AMAMK|nr:hypothetical protein M378DRAFT_162220 [Amanita muscaria Koide BX008]